MGERMMVSNRSIMARLLAINILAGDIHKTHGAHQSEAKVSSLLSNDTEEITDKNADLDYHASFSVENQAGGGSNLEDLCQQDSEKVTRMTPGGSSSRQLEAAGESRSGRLVATEDSSSEVRRSCSQSNEEHEFHNQVSDRMCARCVKILSI